MSIVSLNTIKNWFKTGLKPTQSQFWDAWDSFRHKGDTVPYAEVEGLNAVLLEQNSRIAAIALPDGVTKHGSIIVNSGSAFIPAADFIWRKDQVEYTNTIDFSAPVPAATNGYIRTDIFVGTKLNTIVRVPGPEAIGVAIRPDVPVDTIELGSVDVEGATVSVPVIVRPRVTVYSVNGMQGDVIIPQYFKGVHLTEAALNAAHPTGVSGDSAQVNIVGSTDVVNYSWDAEENIWVNNGAGGSGAINTDGLPEGSTNLYYKTTLFLADLTLARIVAALGYTPSTAPNDAQKNSNITKAEIEAKLTGEISTHTHPGGLGSNSITLNQLYENTTWNFNHGLNTLHPAITVWSISNQIILPSKVEAIDVNNLNLVFPTAISGYATAVGSSTIIEVLPPPVDADAEAFVTAVGTLDIVNQSAVRQLVSDVKGFGLWAKIISLNVKAGVTAAEHKWNLKDPRNLDAAYRQVYAGSWVHSNLGAKSNSTDTFANTFLNPTTLGLTGNIAMGVYVTEAPSSLGGDEYFMGGHTGSNNFFAIQRGTISSVTAIAYSGSGSTPRTVPTNAKGFYAISVVGSTKRAHFETTLLEEVATSGTGVCNVPIYEGSLNLGGRYGSLPYVAGTSFISNGLTNAEMLNLRTAILTYETALGRN